MDPMENPYCIFSLAVCPRRSKIAKKFKDTNFSMVKDEQNFILCVLKSVLIKLLKK